MRNHDTLISILNRMAQSTDGTSIVYKTVEDPTEYHHAQLLIDAGYAVWESDKRLADVLRITYQGYDFLERNT